MLLTRECDYAIRILRVLSGGNTVSIPEICRREEMKIPVAYKLAARLENAGYLTACRGTNGGYALKADLKKITLYDVCRAVDRELFLAPCMEPGCFCARNGAEGKCLVHKELGRIQQILIRELSRRSLYEILHYEEEKQ